MDKDDGTVYREKERKIIVSQLESMGKREKQAFTTIQFSTLWIQS